jgi:hypothetical protein
MARTSWTLPSLSRTDQVRITPLALEFALNQHVGENTEKLGEDAEQPQFSLSAGGYRHVKRHSAGGTNNVSFVESIPLTDIPSSILAPFDGRNQPPSCQMTTIEGPFPPPKVLAAQLCPTNARSDESAVLEHI